MGTAAEIATSGTPPTESPWTFGMHDRLDKAMKVAGVKASEMAAALDVSRNTISNYTSGRTTPSRLQIREWAVRTGAPLEWIETGILPTPSLTESKQTEIGTVTDLFSRERVS